MLGRQRPRSTGGLGLWPFLPALFLVLVLVVSFCLAITLGLVRLLDIQKIQPERTLDVDTLFDLLHILFGCAAGLATVIGLFVAYRRQRTMEHEAQRENTRLFNERFTSACTLLGDGQAAARLGAVNALTVLADDAQSHELRQMCIDQLCSYLKLPVGPKPSPPPAETTPEEQTEYRERRLEFDAAREVRRTAVRNMAVRLREKRRGFLRDHVLDLREATLEVCDLSGLDLSTGCTARFQGTRFVGDRTDFSDTRFSGECVGFEGARFMARETLFNSIVVEHGILAFTRARFCGEKRVVFSGSPGGQFDFNEVCYVSGETDMTGVTGTNATMSSDGITFGEGRLLFVGKADPSKRANIPAAPTGIERALHENPGRIQVPEEWEFHTDPVSSRPS